MYSNKYVKKKNKKNMLHNADISTGNKLWVMYIQMLGASMTDVSGNQKKEQDYDLKNN